MPYCSWKYVLAKLKRKSINQNELHQNKNAGFEQKNTSLDCGQQNSI